MRSVFFPANDKNRTSPENCRVVSCVALSWSFLRRPPRRRSEDQSADATQSNTAIADNAEHSISSLELLLGRQAHEYRLEQQQEQRFASTCAVENNITTLSAISQGGQRQRPL